MIPITIVDDFLENPKAVRDFALQQTFDQTSPAYPGARTRPLHEINEDLFHTIIWKINQLFFFDNPMCNVEMTFQKVEKDFDYGVVHRDDSHTAIIYLNENVGSNSGTSFYELKPDLIQPHYKSEEKHVLIQNKDYEGYKKHCDEINSQFTKTIDVKEKFNRLVTFNGDNYHAANGFETSEDGDPRLTLIAFFGDWWGSRPPLQRMRWDTGIRHRHN